MPYTIRTRDEHLANDGRPKRILALDGGGLRGILTLALLREIETVLRARHGDDPGFRLCHYFDLVAGTSTGAIIAATLALGWSVEQVQAKYMELGSRVFEKTFFRRGVLRAKYDRSRLIDELQGVYGATTTLGSDRIQTGLLLVTKRIDTGSWWPISNNPKGAYFAASPDGTIGNGDYPLWQVVRASTAAPSYFDPETITIASPADAKRVDGEFIDGGVSPFNNPALMAVMYATIEGYRIGWPTGADRLLVVSVGTGRSDPVVKPSKLAAEGALKALLSLMEDCAVLQETMLQWMSSSVTARAFDSEIGDLAHARLGGAAQLSYLRYNVDLSTASVKALDPTAPDAAYIASLSEMDAPENMPYLQDLGTRAGKRDVKDAHFDRVFDLPQT
jgi:predicted acylesterase/phospholipase RssA